VRRKKDSCLACQNKARTRGLCSACYQALRYRLRKEEFTDAEAVEMGLMLPPFTVPQSDFGSFLRKVLSTRRKTRCDARNQSA
jgi:hypothetical protein